ncbi:MAG: ABC transporter ATP-binding protein [Nitrospiraceae bacterium]|nr:ABC transporter ATP-binding protein [Nitrospiraceae bacterium]
MIELRDVTKIYNRSRANEFVALRNVSFGVPERAVTVLKGPSGSGKTTLLTLMGAMARPTSGRVLLSGREITSLPERFLAGIRRSTFGFVFQQLNLIRGLSALENVLIPAYPTDASYASIRGRGRELLARMNVSHREHERVERLSGGEAQRVAIARALINDPQAVIADEPTAHLDTKLSREFMEIVAAMKQDGRTLIIASHDPIVYESPVVDAVLPLRDGMIAEEHR